MRNKIWAMFLMLMLIPAMAFADAPKPINKAISLVNEIYGWLIGAVVLVGGIAFLYQAFIMLTHANEGSVVAGAKAKMKQIGLGVILAASATYIVQFLFEYFK